MKEKFTLTNFSIDSEFISILVHDMRSPYNGLLGFSDLLVNHFSQLNDENKNQYLKTIYSLCNKSFFQTQTMLYWLLIQSGNFELNISPVALHSAAEQCLLAFKNDFEQKNIPVENRLSEQITFPLDSFAFINAISNCIHVMTQHHDISENNALHVNYFSKTNIFSIQLSGIESGITNELENVSDKLLFRLQLAEQILTKHNLQVAISPKLNQVDILFK
jgi:two-component system, sensor histidine kinase and response regulator